MTNPKTYNGYATLNKNAFIGAKSHELCIVITNGNLGDIRRFAVSAQQEIDAKCKQFNVLFNPVFKNPTLGI